MNTIIYNTLYILLYDSIICLKANQVYSLCCQECLYDLATIIGNLVCTFHSSE